MDDRGLMIIISGDGDVDCSQDELFIFGSCGR